MPNPKVTMETTMGTIEIELYQEKAPKTVGNFRTLVDKGFYNGLTFHRIISGFMIQGGCPQGTGMGGPGYTIQDEFKAGISHAEPGVISMANTGRPNSAGSQFFITLEPQPRLDGGYAAFGKVTKGLDVVKAIGKVPTDANDRPRSPVKMTKVTISG